MKIGGRNQKGGKNFLVPFTKKTAVSILKGNQRQSTLPARPFPLALQEVYPPRMPKGLSWIPPCQKKKTPGPHQYRRQAPLGPKIERKILRRKPSSDRYHAPSKEGEVDHRGFLKAFPEGTFRKKKTKSQNGFYKRRTITQRKRFEKGEGIRCFLPVHVQVTSAKRY